MIFDKTKFEKCKFNPYDKVVIDGIEEKTAKYIICLYDPGSPLIKGIQDLTRRREVSLEISGMKSIPADISHEIQHYLQDYAKSMEWALLVSLEETFWEYIARLRQAVTDEKDTDNMRAMAAKTSLAKDAKEILDMHKAELDKFYGGDKDLVNNSGMLRVSRPEDIAKRAANVS